MLHTNKRRPCSSTLSGHPSSSFVFHHSRCDPALSVFASKCQVNVMPERLLSVISGILAGGIPGFRFELCCFSPSYLALFCVSVFSLFCFSSVDIL